MPMEQKLPPMMDVSAWMEMQNRGMGAANAFITKGLVSAGNIAMSGLQEIATRHLKNLQTNMQEVNEAMAAFMAGGASGKVDSSKLQSSLDRAFTQLTTLMSMINDLNAKTADALNKSARECIRECFEEYEGQGKRASGSGK